MVLLMNFHGDANNLDGLSGGGGTNKRIDHEEVNNQRL